MYTRAAVMGNSFISRVPTNAVYTFFIGVFFSCGNSAGIISSNVYPAGDAPRYIRGHTIALAFSVSVNVSQFVVFHLWLIFLFFKVLAIVLSVFMGMYNKLENDRRDRTYGVPNPDGSDCSPAYADHPDRLKRWGLEGKTQIEIIELGDSHPAFR